MAQGLRRGSDQEAGGTRGYGQSWEGLRITGEGCEWPGSGRKRETLGRVGLSSGPEREARGSRAGQEQVGAMIRGQVWQRSNDGRGRKGVRV